MNKIFRKARSQIKYWVRRAKDGQYESDFNNTYSKSNLGYNLNEISASKYLIYSGHDQQIANILDHMLPNFNYNYVKYAASLTMELR